LHIYKGYTTASGGYTNCIYIKATQMHLEATQTTTQTAHEGYTHTVYKQDELFSVSNPL